MTERDSLFKRMVLGLFRVQHVKASVKSYAEAPMEKDRKLDDLAKQFNIPAGVMDDLLLARGDEPAILRIFKHYAASHHVKLSTEGARQLAELLTANKEAQEALYDYVQTQARGPHLHGDIAWEQEEREQERAKARAQHAVDMAKLEREREQYAQPTAPQATAADELKARVQRATEGAKTFDEVRRVIEAWEREENEKSAEENLPPAELARRTKQNRKLADQMIDAAAKETTKGG